MKPNYEIISLESNIGSGKSTLIDVLKDKYQGQSNIVFLAEPVDMWLDIKNKSGTNMLQLFYDDQINYSFSFQMMVLVTFINRVKHVIENYHGTDKLLIIVERSLQTSHYVFAKMLYDDGKMEDVEYEIYERWFSEFATPYNVSKIVYLNTSCENCYKRIHNRARSGEELISKSYLKNLDKYHIDYWLCHNHNVQKLILDGNSDIYANKHVLTEWIEQIDALLRD
jgi:deoxyadenosine/deoxycytidine kinase